MLKKPTVTRWKFRGFDQLLHGVTNWTFMHYCIRFSPWLITVAAAYNITAYLSFNEFQKREFKNRQAKQTQLETALQEHIRNKTLENFEIEEMERVIKYNLLMLASDEAFSVPNRSARAKREINDFATTAMFCVMSGNPFVIGMGSIVVAASMYYNMTHQHKDDLINGIIKSAAFLVAYALAASPSMIFFATLVIAVLKILNMVEYRRLSGSKAYGKVRRAIEKDEQQPSNFNARIGKADSVKMFNFCFTDGDKRLFETSFHFESFQSDLSYNEEHPQNSPYYFPAKTPSDKFAELIPQRIIDKLNLAIDQVFIGNAGDKTFVSTEMRIQALRNIMQEQKLLLAESLSESLDETQLNELLDNFELKCEKRFGALSTFCERYLNRIDERSYYTLLCLTLMHPQQQVSIIKDDNFNILEPSLQGKTFVLFAPTWMCTRQFKVPQTQGVYQSHLDILDPLMEISNTFESLHHWPNFDSWNFYGWVQWCLSIQRPPLQVSFDDVENRHNIYFYEPPINVSNHVLDIYAKIYIALRKALGSEPDSFAVTTKSNRFRRALKRNDEAFANGKPFNIQFLNPENPKMSLEPDTRYTINEDEAHADGLDMHIEERLNPIALPHLSEEERQFNELINHRVNTDNMNVDDHAIPAQLL